MKRLNRSLSFALVTAFAATLLAQSPQVRITPAASTDTTSIEIASDHWTALGYDLKSLIAEIYAVDPARIELPDTTERYDVSLTLSDDATEQQIQRILQQALQRKLNITITPETRDLDVYVITAPNGPGPALHPHPITPSDTDTEHFAYQARVCPGISSGGISASAGTIAEFRRTLEPSLDRPIVNESHLAGAYDFKIGQYRSKEELFELLRNQLGLVFTPSRRSIEILAVHHQPANAQSTAL